jgi:oxygen-independent coproporphyrinogen-3 oxidase
MDDASVGVYVHVPFCGRVCPYCDFAVVAARRLAPSQAARYVDAALRELETRRAAFAGRWLASLYLGGGTPSLLPPEEVERLVGGVRAAFPARGEVETTLEVNPGTLERERLAGFRRAGVERVSLGVQSFDDTTLRRLGRAHRAREVRRSLDACRAAGFEVLSLDLLFGAPGQTRAELEADLAAAVAFGPEHLSVYELTLEPGTPFAEAAARGRLRRPDEELLVEMHEVVEARLGAAGYRRYEISSWARPGREARHNRRYWERRPVLGLGMGAVSSDPPGEEAPFGARRTNLRQLEGYLGAVEAGHPPQTEPPEVLGPETARSEAVFLALRTARGLDAAAFAAEFGAAPRTFYAEVIDPLVAAGLLCEAPEGDLRLSPRGRMLSDTVFAHFVESGEPLRP